MGGAVAILSAALFAGAYDPLIDQPLAPSTGLSVRLGVQRLQDEFGLGVALATPRFLDDHLAVVVGGGVGFYPDLRALPAAPEDEDFGALSLYGHARLALEGSLRLAVASGRLYGVLGPSALFLSERLSRRTFAPGLYGALGVELFAGDDFRSYPFAFYVEIGATAHAASADVAQRSGGPERTDATVDRPIGTGLALAGGLRLYLWR